MDKDDEARSDLGKLTAIEIRLLYLEKTVEELQKRIAIAELNSRSTHEWLEQNTRVA